MSVISAFVTIQAPERRESTLETKLNKTITHFDSVDRPLTVVLLELAYESHLPMGIEYVNSQAAAQPISIHVVGKTLRQVLEMAVAQVPGFRISFESGVVSVYSLQQRQDGPDLLNETIPQFSVVGVDTEDAGAELRCALTRTVDPRAGCFSSIVKGQLGSSRITLTAKNMTVHEILDRIVAQNGDAVWTVTVPPSKLGAIPIVDLWHIYPLQAQFERVAQAKLTELFSQNPVGAAPGREQH